MRRVFLSIFMVFLLFSCGEGDDVKFDASKKASDMPIDSVVDDDISMNNTIKLYNHYDRISTRAIKTGTKMMNLNSIISASSLENKMNYIYAGNLYIETLGDDDGGLKVIDVSGDKYDLDLGSGDLSIDFGELRYSEKNMNILPVLGGDCDIDDCAFPYYIFGEKLGNDDFRINFYRSNYSDESGESVSDVKNISITTCKTNNSKAYDSEYKLTIQKNGNYEFNISTDYNNKCDIPYIINVYYKDGFVDKGEYYILFDY